MLEPELRREIIMEHYTNPLNRGIIEDKKYIKVNTNSETCIDNIDIYLLIENNIIKDIHFEGEACSISTASTSIMIKSLIGKTLEEVEKFIEEYKKMIEGTPHDEELLNEACCFEEIYKQQNRIGCATIPYRGLEKAINEYKNKA